MNGKAYWRHVTVDTWVLYIEGDKFNQPEEHTKHKAKYRIWTCWDVPVIERRCYSKVSGISTWVAEPNPDTSWSLDKLKEFLLVQCLLEN